MCSAEMKSRKIHSASAIEKMIQRMQIQERKVEVEANAN
jgi:hypothetical protein